MPDAELTRYGIDGSNPYKDDGALNPLRQPEHRERFVLGRGLIGNEDIDVALQEAIDNKRACFVLVSGPNKCGRSSFANHVLYRYCALRPDIDCDRFHVPRPPRITHDVRGVIGGWTELLRSELDDAKQDLEEFDARIAEATDLREDVRFRLRLGQNLKKIEQSLKDRSFGALVENIENLDLLDAFIEVLRESQTVVVFTVADYGLNRQEIIKRRPREVRHIELRKLAGDDVKLVAAERWCGRDQHPFDPAGVRDAFTRPETFGFVTLALGQMLEFKLRETHTDAVWTCDELKITPGNISAYLRTIKEIKRA